MSKKDSKNCNCEETGECDCGDDCDCDDKGHNHSNENILSEGNEEITSGVPEQFDEDTRAAIQEIQLLEQNFEQLMQQKHLFNMEITETQMAQKELDKSEGDVFKLVGGQVIIKTTKEKLFADLNHKKSLLEIRMGAIDKQEKEFSDRIEELRQEIMKKISQKAD